MAPKRLEKAALGVWVAMVEQAGGVRVGEIVGMRDWGAVGGWGRSARNTPTGKKRGSRNEQ